MRDTKDSQFLSDTSNRESLANHLDFIINVFAAGLVAATAALLPFVKSERFAYWKGKAIQKGRTL